MLFLYGDSYNAIGDEMKRMVIVLLSLLLAPDKEAAAVFAALGYYPIVKPRLEKTKWPWLWKAVLFNAVILTLYWLLMHLFGMDALAEEFAEAGAVMTADTAWRLSAFFNGIMLVVNMIAVMLLSSDAISQIREFSKNFKKRRYKD